MESGGWDDEKEKEKKRKRKRSECEKEKEVRQVVGKGAAALSFFLFARPL